MVQKGRLLNVCNLLRIERHAPPFRVVRRLQVLDHLIPANVIDFVQRKARCTRTGKPLESLSVLMCSGLVNAEHPERLELPNASVGFELSELQENIPPQSN